MEGEVIFDHLSDCLGVSFDGVEELDLLRG
jgi:hypothetical protein